MNCVCNYVLVCTDNICDTVRVYVCVDRQKKKKKSLCVCGYLGVSRLDVYLFFCVLVLYNNLYVFLLCPDGCAQRLELLRSVASGEY